MAGALNVWMNGSFIGVWSMSRHGVQMFQYDPELGSFTLGPGALSIATDHSRP